MCPRPCHVQATRKKQGFASCESAKNIGVYLVAVGSAQRIRTFSGFFIDIMSSFQIASHSPVQKRPVSKQKLLISPKQSHNPTQNNSSPFQDFIQSLTLSDYLFILPIIFAIILLLLLLLSLAFQPSQSILSIVPSFLQLQTQTARTTPLRPLKVTKIQSNFTN